MRWKTLLANGVAAILLTAVPANAAVTLTLPTPTGRYQVGTTSLHLVDQGRADPWKPDRRRELMVSVWYPVRDASRYPLAHWATPGLVPYLENLGLGIPPGTVDWTSATTSAHVDAPALDRFPVVLYSPGYGAPRSSATVQAQDLASHGYTVVTVDPTYETVVEFPDRVEQPVPQDTPTASQTSLDARVGDVRSVLSALAAHCDADGRPIPPMDLRQVGMFGHSRGGFAAGEAMYHDRRIIAGINLDGGMSTNGDPYTPGEVTRHGLDRPFLLMGNAAINHSHTNPSSDRSWAEFWAVQRSWKGDVQLADSDHYSFTDLEVILPQLGLPDAVLAQVIGTGDPGISVRTQTTTIRRFFDRFLR